MMKRSALVAVLMMLFVTGCASNMFLGYGKVPKDAAYAGLIPSRMGPGLLHLGASGYYVLDVTLHDPNAYGDERSLTLEPEAPFSWGMLAVNSVPLMWLGWLGGEMHRTAHTCYRVPAGRYSLTVEYMHYRVTEKRTSPNGYSLWGYKDPYKRNIMMTFEPGKRYYLAPEYDNAIMTEQEWKSLSHRKDAGQVSAETKQSPQKGEEKQFE